MKFVIRRNKWNGLYKGEIRTNNNYLLIDTEDKIITNHWRAVQIKFKDLLLELLERKDNPPIIRESLLASMRILEEKDHIFTQECKEAFDTDTPKDFCYMGIGGVI